MHRGGTYICIEGPQFSTKAESRIYRSWGVDVIGMTNMPEAKLAREAELCYATLALATDYDCWHETHEAVTVEAVIRNLLQATWPPPRTCCVAVIPRDRAAARACALRRRLLTQRGDHRSPATAPPPAARNELDLLARASYCPARPGRRTP